MKLSAPLSKSQFGIYVECASHQNEPFYNLPYYYVLDRSHTLSEMLSKACRS